MITRLVLLSLLSISWVAAQYYKPDEYYADEFKADKDFLLKQKRIYNILYHFSQPELKADLYKEGTEYKIEANIGSYTKPEAVEDFLHRLEHGFLSHDAVFSIFYPRHAEETAAAYRVMFFAKDFETFYKTALFCRNRLNHYMFLYAFYLAVINRPDTKYMKLPAPYEVMPHSFFNSELFEKAHHIKHFGKLEPKHSAGYDTYIIPYNYSNFYISNEYDYEQRLTYFMEDIGFNTLYFYLRSEYPFFLSKEDLGPSAEFRGHAYLINHLYILKRYYLERLSNGLGKIEDYDYDRPFYPCYYPTLTYPNGLPYPSRPCNSYFPKNKYHQIHESEEYETRISQAVDSGMSFNKEGKITKMTSPDALNILGNIIEGNLDSCNKKYYGSIDQLGRSILGFSLNPQSKDKLQPSALEHFSTSLRDPAFYRLYKKILHFYFKFTANLEPYKPEEIQFPDLKIESFDVDKLTTYFDYYDTTISNGLAVANKEEAEAYLIQARQYRINHKPFNVRFTINAEKPTKAIIKLFLGPKYNAQGKEFDQFSRLNFFWEMDYFIYDLSAGANKIERSCHDFLSVGEEPEPSEVFYKKLLKAIESGEELKYKKGFYAVPERFLLPKGKPEGMPFQFFAFVAPAVEVGAYASPIFGAMPTDFRAYGYPIDRPAIEYDFHGPNFFYRDVLIYHKQEHDYTVTH